MNKSLHIVLHVLLLLLLSVTGFAQEKDRTIDYSVNKDVIDIYYKIIHKKNSERSDTVRKTPGKLYSSFFITPSYAVQSGFGIDFSNVSAMYLSESANISSLLTYITFTQKKQIIIPILTNIFTKDNRWNFQGNRRYLKYPVSTFGLGNHTSNDNEVKLDFSTLRISELFLRKAGKNVYAGAGYSLSKYWNIIQSDKGTNDYYDQYRFDTNPFSSGFLLCFQYDSRENSLNPRNASYFNTTFSQNLTALGSNTNWSSLMIDARHYMKFPAGSNNVLAFWNYDVLTLAGKPPYLDLPSNGWDEYFKYLPWLYGRPLPRTEYARS